MSRFIRAEMANETVSILETGSYCLPNGAMVDISKPLVACVSATKLFQPEYLKALLETVRSSPKAWQTTHLELANETTLAGISRMLAESHQVAALNFASAKNPGGGFLNGSQAQEESLARSSGLYPSLMKAWPYYELHRGIHSSSLYTDAMILSPNCPIIRNDAGDLLAEVQCAGFITSAAPNAGATRMNHPEQLPQIAEVLQRRAEFVLALAASQHYSHLVLGAWGCGVFQNDPVMVASVFKTLLESELWSGRFAKVVFSVFDTSAKQEVLGAFRSVLGCAIQEV